MKKNATTEEKVAFVAKTLVKEFKSAKEDENYLSIVGNFTNVCSNKFNGTHLVFRSGYKEEVDFGELSDEGFGSITCKIADAICAKLKPKKSEILSRNNEEHTKWASGWYGTPRKYTECKGIYLIKPCKGFFAINKKLKALGLNEINFTDWYHCEVAGKRSSIFSRDYHWYAESEKKCARVLEYLKGKKKLAYEFVDCDDLEDRRRGEYYETEWYGSMAKEIQFTDTKGHQTVIY